HAERELILVVLPEYRVELEKVQRIVHPAHHPFHAETKSARKGWPADPGPVRCLLRNGLNIGEIAEDGRIEVLYEGDSLQVAVSAIFVRLPGALLPGVVELEHRAYRVHPHPVRMEFVEPEPGIADQERPHLAPAIIKNVTVPVRMESLTHIGILICVGSIEKIQT